MLNSTISQKLSKIFSKNTIIKKLKINFNLNFLKLSKQKLNSTINYAAISIF